MVTATATTPVSLPELQVDVADAARRARPIRWAIAVIFVAVAVYVLVAIIRNPNIEWSVVGHYLTYPTVLSGLWTTIWLTAASMVLGTALGTLLALARNSTNLLIKIPADIYVWFFRGTPLLIQLIFWYNFAIFMPRVELSIPFTDITLISSSTNDVIVPLMAALLGLTLHEAAYMSEIVRAGILSVPKGQRDAAMVLGLSSSQIVRQITLPQAMRVIVPPTGNQVISMLKATSLVSVMSVFELFYSAQTLYTNNGKIIPLLVVASLWYLALTSVLYIAQAQLERRYGRGSVPRRARGRRRLSLRSPATIGPAA